LVALSSVRHQHDLENLPPPDVIAQEIVEDLEAALGEFAAVAESLGPPSEPPS
jgi:type I restriction enzyme M protein